MMEYHGDRPGGSKGVKELDAVEREVETNGQVSELGKRTAALQREQEESEDDDSQGRKRKRDESSRPEDRMVPYLVPGFCQGCGCSQNVYVLGAVMKRRFQEVKQIHMALEKKYKVSLPVMEEIQNDSKMEG